MLNIGNEKSGLDGVEQYGVMPLVIASAPGKHTLRRALAQCGDRGIPVTTNGQSSLEV